ncbi:glycosyl transferase family protein [Octadecabacter sp.]|nr:glycosyl transferase family protein [Octadecabacter sp.]
MILAETVRILGRGQGRARSLTQDEAFNAMQLMLTGTAAPEAIGATLMLMRMKGEIAEEIAGFVQAAQSALPTDPIADLDWSAYAAGRTRGSAWFLHSANAVAAQGHRVLLHGWNGTDTAIRDGVAQLGIPTCETLDAAKGALDNSNIAYLPLEVFHPALFDLLILREKLGLRSCVNTVCRMLNPGRARASVQGVFHPSYRLLQSDAAQLMGWDALSVIKGGGGEFERHPGKAIEAFGLHAGTPWQDTLPALIDDQSRLVDHSGDVTDTSAAFVQAMIDGTTELALETLKHRTNSAAA